MTGGAVGEERLQELRAVQLGQSSQGRAPDDLPLGLLAELSQEQAEYIGVPQEGPYKPDYYRY